MSHAGMDAVPALVAAAVQGDQEAWRELVERYTPLVASVVRRHRLSGGEAEDVMQTVWLRLVENLTSLRDPLALPGWISTTVRHECVRTLKLRRGTVPTDTLEYRPPAGQGDLDVAMLEAERHEALLAALAELPRRQRELLLLLLEDPPVPYDEISHRLEMPIGSIGPTRARALARVRAHPAVSALQDR